MENFILDDFTKGWFIGNFIPTIYRNNDFEIAIKEYKAGDYEETHFHKISTEITCILNGEVLMNGTKYKHGDIIKIEPNESTNFNALTNVLTVVVKYPSSIGDKYFI